MTTSALDPNQRPDAFQFNTGLTAAAQTDPEKTAVVQRFIAEHKQDLSLDEAQEFLRGFKPAE